MLSKYRNQIKSLFEIDDPHVILMRNGEAIALRKRGVKCYALVGNAVGSLDPGHLWWYVLTGPSSIVATLSYSVIVNYSLVDFLTMYKEFATADEFECKEFGLLNNYATREVSDLTDIAYQLTSDQQNDAVWYNRKTRKLHLNATAL